MSWILSWFLLQASTNSLQVKATTEPEARESAHSSGSSEEPHNSSGFPILRFKSLCKRKRFVGAAFQNEKSHRSKINCSCQNGYKSAFENAGFSSAHAMHLILTSGNEFCLANLGA